MCGDTCSSLFTSQSRRSSQPCSMQQRKRGRLLHGKRCRAGGALLPQPRGAAELRTSQGPLGRGTAARDVPPTPSLPCGRRGVPLDVPVMGSADSGSLGGKLSTTVLFPAPFSTYPDQNAYFCLPVALHPPPTLTKPSGLPRS